MFMYVYTYISIYIYVYIFIYTVGENLRIYIYIVGENPRIYIYRKGKFTTNLIPLGSIRLVQNMTSFQKFGTMNLKLNQI